MKEVCYPFYVFKLLGVEKVVLTNACGGINREFAPVSYTHLDKVQVGNRIRGSRLEKGWTQERLAAEAEISEIGRAHV